MCVRCRVVYVSFVIRTGTSDLEGEYGELHNIFYCWNVLLGHFRSKMSYLQTFLWFSHLYLKTVEWPLLPHHLILSHRYGKLGMSQPALECLFSDIELIWRFHKKYMKKFQMVFEQNNRHTWCKCSSSTRKIEENPSSTNLLTHF